jgi:hypothetical protein
MHDIHVRFGVAPSARGEFRFAVDLAERLGGRLFVWTDRDAAARKLLEGIGPPSVDDREHAHVHDRVRLEIAAMGSGLVPKSCQGDPSSAVRDGRSILVGSRASAASAACASIATMGELSLLARGSGDVCVPFANGESGVRAAAFAVPFAIRLGLGVLFYHTTWREEGVPEGAAAERHMIPGTHETLARLRAVADLSGVRHRALIETAPAVAEGFLRAALREGCALIALARGTRVGRGSYVDQALERSVIPVLTAGRSRP